jgi:hypothetical protein
MDVEGSSRGFDFAEGRPRWDVEVVREGGRLDGLISGVD